MTDSNKPFNEDADKLGSMSDDQIFSDDFSTKEEQDSFEEDLFGAESSDNEDWLDDSEITNSIDLNGTSVERAVDDDFLKNSLSIKISSNKSADQEIAIQKPSQKNEFNFEDDDEFFSEQAENSLSFGNSNDVFLEDVNPFDEEATADEEEFDLFADTDSDEAFSEEVNPFDEEVTVDEEESDLFADTDSDAAFSEEVNPFDEEATADEEESDLFADTDSNDAFSEEVNPFDEEATADEEESDLFSDTDSNAAFSEEVNPFDEESTADEEESDLFSDTDGDDAFPEEVNPFDEEATADEEESDLFSDTDSDDAFPEEVNPFDEEATADEEESDLFTDTDNNEAFSEDVLPFDGKSHHLIEEGTKAIEQPKSDFQDEEKTGISEEVRNEKAEKKEKKNMNQKEAQDVLSQVRETEAPKSQSSRGGVGVITSVIVSAIMAGGAVFAHQEFIAPKNVITQDDLEMALSHVTKSYEEEISRNEDMVIEAIISELKKKGVINDDLNMTLPEVASIASDAKKLAEKASSSSDANSRLIARNKQNHEKLSNEYDTQSQLESEESKKFKKALRALWQIKKDVIKEKESYASEMKKVLEDIKANKVDSERVLKQITDLSALQAKLSAEIEEIKTKKPPEPSNKVQEALGLPPTGINIVKHQPLPFVQVKGVIKDMILLIREGQNTVETYKVGQPIDGYGKILEIMPKQLTARTEKGMLNKN